MANSGQSQPTVSSLYETIDQDILALRRFVPSSIGYSHPENRRLDDWANLIVST